MENPPTLISILLGIGSLLGLFLAINLIFLKKGTKKANLILMLLVLSISAIIFHNFIALSGYYLRLPHLSILFYPLNGLLGPLFFFHIIFLTQPKRKIKWYYIFHLTVFFVLLYRHIPFAASDASFKIHIVEYIYFGDYALRFIDLAFILFVKSINLGYAIAAVFILQKKIEKLKIYSADTLIASLSWLKILCYLFASFILLSAIISTINFYLESSIRLLEIHMHLVNTAFIFTIAIIMIQQPGKLFYVFEEVIPKVNNSQKIQKLEKTIEELLELMKKKKPYLTPGLKIHDLASMLNNVPPYSLSDQINKHLGINFYDFVNGYRIEEFKKRVNKNEHNNQTLLGIAHDVGFNSKASFNRIFKKHTGQTPTEYLRAN